MNSLQKTTVYASVFVSILSVIGAMLMIRKFSDGVDLILNPVVYFIVTTLAIAIVHLAINFEAMATRASAMISARGMIALLASCLTTGVSFPAIYLIEDNTLQLAVLGTMLLLLVAMFGMTISKARKIKDEKLQPLKKKYSEKYAHKLVDENLSIMHNLPPALSILIIILALIGYNMIRAFPTLSGICLLLSLGFISLICYQFSFACWLVANRLNKLKC